MTRRRIGATTGIAVTAALAATLAALPATGAGAEPSVVTGPSTNTKPYVLPVAPGVQTTSLLTVSDGKTAADGYAFAGIPDGIGLARGPRGDVVAYVNHEIGVDSVTKQPLGAVRRHGQAGSFVSKLTIDRRTLQVEQGQDLIDPGVAFWNYPERKYQAAPSPAGVNPRNAADTFVAQTSWFVRFCSGSLTDLGQLLDRHSGRGYGGRIYFANEENGDESRTFGVTEDGTAKQLPRLGQFSHENTLLADTRSASTVVVGDEDGADGQLWVYRGAKQRRGDAFDRAGLTNGTNSVVRLTDAAVTGDAQFRAAYGKGEPARFELTPVDHDQSGKAQNAEAKADGLSLNRIEDGAFDPRNPNDFYFVTTEGAPDPSRNRDGGGLWKLSFEDVGQPELGGTLTLLLDGSEAPYLNKPDNVDIDRHGNLLIQEDPGGNPHVSRIVAYQIETGRRGVIAQFDPALFAPATPGGTDAVLTVDEESSGIVDAEDTLGRGWFVFDAQVHKKNPDPAAVEYGQLLALKVDGFERVYDQPQG